MITRYKRHVFKIKSYTYFKTQLTGTYGTLLQEITVAVQAVGTLSYHRKHANGLDSRDKTNIGTFNYSNNCNHVFFLII